MYYLKAFFNSFKVEWLQEQKNEGKKSANYIILFVLLFSILYAGYFSNIIPQELTKIRNEVFKVVPEFSAELVDGKLTISDMDQPFVFESEADGEPFKLIVDTVNTTTVSIENIIEDKTVSTVIINQTNAIIYDTGVGKTTIQDFNDFPNVSLTKREILEWSNDFLNKKTTFFAFLLVAWFVIFTVSRVIYSIILSFLIFTIARIVKREDWKFGQIYTVSLFAVTGPSVIVALAGLADIYFPYLYTFLTLLLLFVVIFYKKKRVEDVVDENSNTKIEIGEIETVDEIKKQ